MAYVMSAKKAGVCKDCGAAINVGDPIVYFPRHGAYGLSCHVDPRQEKHVAKAIAAGIMRKVVLVTE